MDIVSTPDVLGVLREALRDKIRPASERYREALEAAINDEQDTLPPDDLLEEALDTLIAEEIERISDYLEALHRWRLAAKVSTQVARFERRRPPSGYVPDLDKRQQQLRETVASLSDEAQPVLDRIRFLRNMRKQLLEQPRNP